MAEKGMSFSAVERAWILKSLETQLKAVLRARSKEVEGSEVARYRSREAEALQSLITRFGGM